MPYYVIYCNESLLMISMCTTCYEVEEDDTYLYECDYSSRGWGGGGGCYSLINSNQDDSPIRGPYIASGRDCLLLLLFRGV